MAVNNPFYDKDRVLRCKEYVNPTTRCNKQYCEKLHVLPKEINVMCWFESNNKCRYSSNVCPFRHTTESYADPPQAYFVVEPMSATLERLRVRERNRIFHLSPHGSSNSLQWIPCWDNGSCTRIIKTFHTYWIQLVTTFLVVQPMDSHPEGTTSVLMASAPIGLAYYG